MAILRLSFILIFLLSYAGLCAQPLQPGSWVFSLHRNGGTPVWVRVDLQSGNPYWQAMVLNAKDTIRIEKVQVTADSVCFDMPVFESAFRLKIVDNRTLSGHWMKGISSGSQVWEVQANYGKEIPIPLPEAPPQFDISGKWQLSIQRADGSWRPAIAQLEQEGSKLTGTIINPSGDYRYLSGEVRGNLFYLAVFDGAGSYAFTAQIPNDSTIQNGLYFSGAAPGNAFTGKKNAKASLPVPDSLFGLQPGMQHLSFTFPDLDGKMVSIRDKRFQNKITIVQLMGSWCPNCMDETKFLSDFYNQQETKEVEIVSLAYELSTNFERSAASLRKFQQRFHVQYPMLITGVRSADTDKAAKSLPQLTEIKAFPITIFLDSKGVIRKIHHGFYSSAAPAYFEEYKKSFFATLDALKNE